MDRVPTVFVESPPPPPPLPPPPAPVQEERGGLVISRGFLGVLVVLFLGAAIAGTGFYYIQYDGAQKKLAADEKALGEQKAVVATRDATIASQATAIQTRDATLKAHELQYGQIESLLADGAKTQKDIEDLLKRRPNTPGLPDRLKQGPPLWRDGAVQQLQKYVADLQKEFTRIDKAVGVPGQTGAPATPHIQTQPTTPSPN